MIFLSSILNVRMELMKFYPVSLDVSNERCVVVGGGDVAERKVIRLLECGATVCCCREDPDPGVACNEG